MASSKSQMVIMQNNYTLDHFYKENKEDVHIGNYGRSERIYKTVMGDAL